MQLSQGHVHMAAQSGTRSPKKWLRRAVGCENANDNDEQNDEEVEPEFRTKSVVHGASRWLDVDDERCPRALVFVKSKQTQEE